MRLYTIPAFHFATNKVPLRRLGLATAGTSRRFRLGSGEQVPFSGDYAS